MVYSTVLYYLDGSVAFKLDASKFHVSNRRSTESLDIPGIQWNTWFDNNNIVRKWTITGKFAATDAAWDGTLFTGRPLDFLHYLSCALNAIDSVTGASLTPASTYNGFQLEINQVFGGVTYTHNIYSKFGATQPVILLFNELTFDLEGGSPGMVDYTIYFDEVDTVINLGR